MMACGDDEIEDAMEALFRAYDIDESGELTRNEYIKIESRICLEKGETVMPSVWTAKMTLADKDRSGAITFMEFRDRTLSSLQAMDMTRDEIIKHANEHVKLALTERAKMGPRYHVGIRQALRTIFELFDQSGDGKLSPEEWIMAQKVVAMEVSDELDEGWIDEAGFNAADLNGDGVLDQQEFMESSFCMFEGLKKRTDAILATLTRITKYLKTQGKAADRTQTEPVTVYVQTSGKPEFRPPHAAWQDEPTQECQDRNAEMWTAKGQLALPLNLATAEEVMSLLRMHLGWPMETWLAVFFCGPARDAGPPAVMHLRGERQGEGNVQAMLRYFTKPNAELKLFLKNRRVRPQKLTRQPRAFLEEREQLLSKRAGQSWGIDWETQLVGEGSRMPPLPLVIALGDALVLEVPVEIAGNLDRYTSSVYMDGTGVLSKPIDETIEPKKTKKAPKKAPDDAGTLMQLVFIALKEGRSIFFVDLTWEDQEEKLAEMHGLVAPVSENSVARIGPLEVEVQKPPVKTDKDKGTEKTFVWWNGEKWSNKKGPAKKKKGGRK